MANGFMNTLYYNLKIFGKTSIKAPFKDIHNG